MQPDGREALVQRQNRISPLPGASKECFPPPLTPSKALRTSGKDPEAWVGGYGFVCVCTRTHIHTHTCTRGCGQVTSASYCCLASATTCWCSSFILSIFRSCSRSTSWRFSLRRPLSCRAGGRDATCKTEAGAAPGD